MTMRTRVMSPNPPARDRLDLRCEPDWLARVERQAKRFGMTVSAYIKRAVTVSLEADEDTDPDRRCPSKG